MKCSDYITNTMLFVCYPVSLILSPGLGDIVDSGIGLSYRHARLHIGYSGTVWQPYMPESTISPSQGLRIWPLCHCITAGQTLSHQFVGWLLFCRFFFHNNVRIPKEKHHHFFAGSKSLVIITFNGKAYCLNNYKRIWEIYFFVKSCFGFYILFILCCRHR
jgi:hypothetical protein